MNYKQEQLMNKAKHFLEKLTKVELTFLVLMIYSLINDYLYYDNLHNLVLLIYDFNCGKLRKPQEISYERISRKLNMDTKTLLKKRKILEQVCLNVNYIIIMAESQNL